jgi:hypothetical protein
MRVRQLSHRGRVVRKEKQKLSKRRLKLMK